MSTYRNAALALAILCVAFFAPILVRGQVIYPHDNSIELGVHRPEALDVPSNRKFSDQSSVYVPEIHHHLHGDHRAWLSTWNPHVELGRPSMQISGFSPAFPLTRLLALFTGDEFVLATWLAILNALLIACFAFLFLKSLELHPWAAFAGAALLSMSVFTIHYLNVVMLLATFAWSLALLWLITRFVQRRTFASGVAIAFATYALFMTGYPQQIVWHAYMIGLYAITRVWNLEPTLSRRATAVGCLLVAALAGVVMCAPVYLDLLLQAEESARLDADADFFLARLPVIRSLADLLQYLGQFTDPLWRGNPITIGNQDTFNGLSFTPLCVALFLLSWMDGEWRRSWLWIGFGVVTLVMTVWPAAYLFGVDHLGLSLSRTVPLRAGVLPWTVATAMVVDRILRVGLQRRVPAIALVLCPLGVAFAGQTHDASALVWPYVIASAAFFGAVAAFVVHRGAAWVPLLVIATVFHYGHRMLLVRTEAEIQRTSPLVEKLGELTAGGVRYACVGAEEPRLLPPNQEVRLGLRSIHSYNPLSSRSYQEWVLRLSETGTRTYGRQFRRIASEAKLSSDDVGYSGIGVFVSARNLHSPALSSVGEVDGVRLYRPLEKPVLEAQIETFELAGDDAARIAGPLSRQRTSSVRRTLNRDDALRFELTPARAQTLLFVSQQFHPHWQASSDGRSLRTVRINDFYQGVVVPENTTIVDLDFEPYAVWSWVPQVVFAAAGVACAWSALRRRRRSA